MKKKVYKRDLAKDQISYPSVKRDRKKEKMVTPYVYTALRKWNPKSSPRDGIPDPGQEEEDQ
jgi:hypothetical protein